MKATKTMKSANSISPRVIISLISLFALLLLLVASLSGATRPSIAHSENVSASKAGQARSQQLGQPRTPLENLLNKDGTLILDSGFTGGLDPIGWQMTTDSNGQPHFVRIQTGNIVKQYGRNHLGPAVKPGSAFAPLISGDENWDDRFDLPSIDGLVSAIAISGSNVYVGGRSGFGGGVLVGGIARWDGNQWYPLGSGVEIPDTERPIQAIGISGSNVYVGGYFHTAGGVNAHSIARWDGTQWHSLGSGTNNGVNGFVHAIVTSGTDVYVGGDFNAAGDVLVNGIARWDGNQWHSLGSAVGGANYNNVASMAITGTDLYIGGAFYMVGGVTVNKIARWDGTQWYPLGNGTSDEIDGTVLAIEIRGSDVFAGGHFITAGGVSANNIARWDGTQWHPLGVSANNGVNDWVVAIEVSDSNLYVGGNFTEAGGVSTNNIARWDGEQWYPLGSGVNSVVNVISVSALDVFAGGYFTAAGNKPSSNFGIWHDQWLASHMTWQGRPTQHDQRLQLPITLTLKSATTEINYPSQSSSSNAVFTTGVGTLAVGTYNWRAKNPKYLANAGAVSLTGAPITNLDMGLMRAGDANDDNVITALDFDILKPTYGLGIGEPGYDDRADFNGDQRVTIQDFDLLKVNFGQGGAPPIRPNAP